MLSNDSDESGRKLEHARFANNPTEIANPGKSYGSLEGSTSFIQVGASGISLRLAFVRKKTGYSGCFLDRAKQMSG